MKDIIYNQYGERRPILKTENIQIRGQVTKLEAIKMQYACIFFYISWIQKFEYSISQGIVATCLRWGGQCHVGFVANFMHFLAV